MKQTMAGSTFKTFERGGGNRTEKGKNLKTKLTHLVDRKREMRWETFERGGVNRREKGINLKTKLTHHEDHKRERRWETHKRGEMEFLRLNQSPGFAGVERSKRIQISLVSAAAMVIGVAAMMVCDDCFKGQERL